MTYIQSLLTETRDKKVEEITRLQNEDRSLERTRHYTSLALAERMSEVVALNDALTVLGMADLV